MNND
jgi:hypothetical protein